MSRDDPCNSPTEDQQGGSRYETEVRYPQINPVLSASWDVRAMEQRDSLDDCDGDTELITMMRTRMSACLPGTFYLQVDRNTAVKGGAPRGCQRPKRMFGRRASAFNHMQ